MTSSLTAKSAAAAAAATAGVDAERIFGRLQGLFCLYKERGTLIEGMRKNFAEKMTEDINSKEQRPIRRLVRINEDHVGTDLPVVTTVPDLSDHPLVIGPRFVTEDFGSNLRPLNPLSESSSGLQLFGFGEFGRRLVDRLAASKPVNVYHVTGKLGIATDNFFESGRLVERATYHHVNETRLDRVIQAWQADHRDLMFRETGIDYSSQAAFETASRGFTRPKADFRSAVFVAVDLVKFTPPYFTVEVQATNGDCVDFSELIHHLGMACRTRAAAARVHRLRAGPFTLKDALLFNEWNCDRCVTNVEANSRLLDEMEKRMLADGGLAFSEGSAGDSTMTPTTTPTTTTTSVQRGSPLEKNGKRPMAEGGLPEMGDDKAAPEGVPEIDILMDEMSLVDSSSSMVRIEPGQQQQQRHPACQKRPNKTNEQRHRPRHESKRQQRQLEQRQHQRNRPGEPLREGPFVDESSIKLAKSSIRAFVWSTMESHQLIQPYPPTCHDRIPNFIGSRVAADRLVNTREFRRAAVVKVNPSLAQMPLRYSILEAGKTLLVPTPALSDEAFIYSVDPSTFTQNWHKKRASSKKGAQELGSALSVDQLSLMGTSGFRIDLYVVAAVAVCRNGVRLGKGRGFAELEWAILHGFGLVDADTVVATTVHEAQLLDEDSLHAGLMESHDLPVDLIVTPKRIVNARRKESGIRKPEGGVLWDEVTEEMLNDIPVLRKLKEGKQSAKESKESAKDG